VPFPYRQLDQWWESGTGLILPISEGGTGATTAAGALSNLGAPSLTATQTWTGVNFFTGSKLRTSDLIWMNPGNTVQQFEWYTPGDGTIRLFDDVNARDLLIATPGATSAIAGLTINGTLTVAGGGTPATAAKGTVTGDGTTSAFTITHNLNKASPYQMIAQFYNRTGSDQETHPSISGRGANSFTATWSVAPANGALIDWQVI